MRLVVTGFQGNGFTEVTAEHNGEKLAFATKVYGKVKLNDQQRVFREINRYWEYLGMHAQQHIWECYKNIHSLFEMALDSSQMADTLKAHLVDMYSVMPMDGMRRWLTTLGNLFIPVEVERIITAESRYTKAEQTYLIHEYVILATGSLFIRPLIPVIGEFMENGSERDSDKEDEVVGLMSGLEIMNWPLNEKGPLGEPVDTMLDKLDTYVKFCVDDEPNAKELARLWKGQATIAVPTLMRSKALVRRLAIVTLDDPSSFSIVANVYHYVRTNLSPNERTTADRVSAKTPESGGEEGEKTSFMESLKTNYRVCPGDIEVYILDTYDQLKLVKKIDPTIDVGKLNTCIAAMHKNSNSRIQPHQVQIAQWVMAGAFPPRAFPHLNKMALHNLLACAQALMWHWGFLDAAVFMQVDMIQHTDEGMNYQLSSANSALRIPTKYRDELDEVFPHRKAPQYQSNGNALKIENMASMAINTANASIHANTWVFRGPLVLFKEAGQLTEGNILVVPRSIKATLTELVLHLGRINR